LTEPRSILVVSLRYLGDMLLATPLIGTLRAAWPGAAIDVLAIAGAEGAVEGNPDVRRAIATGRGEFLALWRSIGRRYDLAVIAETADRPHFCGWLAAPRRVGLLPTQRSKRWWKAPLLERAVESPENLARPLAYRKLAEALGIAWRPAMVAPTAHTADGAWRALVGFDAAAERFAVLHVAPRFRYKRWNTPGWHALMGWLHGQGLRVVVTGGLAENEHVYVREVIAGAPAPVVNVAGRLSFAQTADLLRRAAIFVGPDTATTHLAAACGTPTVALFGPTDPRLWGPIPRDGLAQPYEKVMPLQRRERVALLQEPSLDCVPCQQEGCDRHRDSRAECLDRMDAARVIAAAQGLLSRSGA